MLQRLASPPLHLQARVEAMVEAFRSTGHRAAHLNPLAPTAPECPELDTAGFGFSEADLNEVVSSRHFQDARQMPLREMIDALRSTYSETLGVEFSHIQNREIREWVANRVENRRRADRNSAELHREILARIHEAETFESFIHTKYVGQKRFSLEGGESLMLSLNTILENCPKFGVLELVMGMAHRGRLNVLANFLQKPASVIFNEFQDNFTPELVGGNGDVKYHLGYHTTRELPGGHKVEIRLAANPSHLEAVDPVVEGKARARQRVLEDTAERKKVIPILVHGDAAFIGQGIVAETFNMSQLQGYRTGAPCISL
jgi:2-oxoglutarate dehydrogenase E1 component